MYVQFTSCVYWVIINENVDILCIEETEIDESFPTTQFILPGYHKPYRLDISDKQGGLLIYITAHYALQIIIKLYFT